MDSRSILGSDGMRATNYLCLSCLHRQVVKAKNPIMSIEDKTPLQTIIHNPHQGGQRLQMRVHRPFPVIESCNVPITQEQIDAAVDEDD